MRISLLIAAVFASTLFVEPAQAEIVISTSGSDLVATITSPISWTLNGDSPSSPNIWLAVFDGIGNGSATASSYLLTGTATLTIGGVTSNGYGGSRPGGGDASNDLTSDDAWPAFLFDSFPKPQNGDLVTLSAGTLVWQGIGSYLPNLTSPFTGDVFLANGTNGIRVGTSSGSAAIPEPTAAMFLCGTGALACLRRRRR